MKLIIAVFVSSIFFLNSCTPLNHYEKRVDIPKHQWAKDFVPVFEFDNSNQNTAKRMYLIVRHTNNYPYTNLHVRIQIKTPKDSVMQFEKEIFLTKDNQNKAWANKGMDNIFEVKYPIGPFNGEKGKFKISVENTMRDNPLPEIMNIGLAIENLQQ